MIVDAHCHTSDRWYEPVEVLVSQMDRLSIDVGILTQYSGQFDNSYQQEALKRYPGRLASVVVVNSALESAPDDLAKWVDGGASGVRIRPTDRMSGADGLALWRRADALGIPVSTLGEGTEFLSPQFQEVLETFPDLPIIIEHLGTRGETGLSFTPEEARQIYALSRYPNLYMKFHGLAEFSPRVPDRTSKDRFLTPLRPHLELALNAFGAERLMWGSDFPPVSAREGYESSLTGPIWAFRELGASDEDIEKMFANNAARLFHISVPGIKQTPEVPHATR